MRSPIPSAPKRLWDDPRIVFPDEATWARLSPEERERVIEEILLVEHEYLEAMAEGVRHSKNKTGIGADLDGHFRRAGRPVFLATELAVLYPGEPMIVPDVLAVVDCDPDIEPDTWVVLDQGRGIDLVIEVRNLGRKHKDLVENVRDYARLGIPEYFSFDCVHGHLRGWRLGAAGGGYQPIVPQGGYLRSVVLGLELATVGKRLRFFANASMVPDAAELVARLQGIADDRQSALEAAEREREAAEREREAAEREREAAEREREAAARARDHALEREARLRAALARTVVEACRARGLALTDAQRARVEAEADVAVLSDWASRVFDVARADELFATD
ncbi:MAG: Uma2 family endonuclease [Sandaracinaceae bacterium]|nr:Uma2 family endonuclease [Sandaracinaceae bacterium]